MPLLDLNGVPIYYEDSGGDGLPIVFSHGLLWSGRMYDKQVEHLRGRFRCITYDHRGQGQSPQSPVPYDMEALSRDGAALIEKLGIGPCHWVGLSMGGFVGMRLGARRPELIRSLVLIDTAADREPRVNIPKYRLMSLATRVIGYGPLVPTIMKIMCAPSFLHDPARQAERRALEQHLLARPYEPTRQALEAVITRQPIEEELGCISCPTLILHGTDDTAIVPPRARRMAAAIPGARFVEIPRAGHTSTVEEPAAINAALDAFLSAPLPSQTSGR